MDAGDALRQAQCERYRVLRLAQEEGRNCFNGAISQASTVPTSGALAFESKWTRW